MAYYSIMLRYFMPYTVAVQMYSMYPVGFWGFFGAVQKLHFHVINVWVHGRVELACKYLCLKKKKIICVRSISTIACNSHSRYLSFLLLWAAMSLLAHLPKKLNILLPKYLIHPPYIQGIVHTFTCPPTVIYF